MPGTTIHASRRRLLPAAALVLAVAAGGPVSVRAESKTVTEFLQHYVTGCIGTQKRGGLPPTAADAFCVCAAAQFRMSGTESALEDVAARAIRNESIIEAPIFKAAIRNRQQCKRIGTHDTAALPEGYPKGALGSARRFEDFSMALPDDFLLMTRNTNPGQRSYGYHRFHRDLQSVSTLQMVVTRDRGAGAQSGDADQAAEFELRKQLDILGGRRLNWRAEALPAATFGGLGFRAARFEAVEEGEAVVGEIYVARAGDRTVLLRIQDLSRHAARTMPLMRESLRTFRLR